ncbi:MAG: SoxR reducing system RseC family protein [Pseudomonadales bacterium]
MVERDGQIAVQFDAACGGGGCGACAGRGERRLSLALLRLNGAARVGDRVCVEVGSGSLNRIAAACFALPLAALLVGAGIGGWLSAGTGFDAEVVSGVVGLCSLALALGVISRSGGALLRMLKLDARLERMNS